MIPCEPCRCGGRRLVYRKKRGARFVTRYRRCVECGAVSKTIQRSEPDDFLTLLERTHQIGLELVTADETDAKQQLPLPHDAP